MPSDTFSQEPTEWLPQFPALAGLDKATARLLIGVSRTVTFPAGRVIFEDGSPASHYTLIVDGVVRVQKVAESGREIVLYRVESGQSCMLNTSCLMTGGSYGAEAVAETEVKAILLPAAVFHDVLGRSDAFRRFVFTAYSTRIADLLCLIEEVAFGRIDTRLAQCLLDHAAADKAIHSTHQELAVELGTAREVISRQLKDFERRGWVTLFRGRIEPIDHERLAELAAK